MSARKLEPLQSLPWLAIAFGYAVVIWFATWPPGFRLDLFEYGHWLGPASDMLAGKVPYRDTFPVHGFLSDGGIDYLLFRLVGPTFYGSIWLHQALGVMFQPALLLVVAGAARKARWTLASVPLSLALAPGLVFDRGAVPLLGLAAFLWAIDERPQPWAAAAAGALGGIGFLYALDFGTFVLAAECATIGSIWIVGRGSPVIRHDAFAGGLLAILAPFAIWMAVHSALIPFVRVSFIDLPRQIGHVWGLPFPGPLDAVRYWILGQREAIRGIPESALGPGLRLYLIPMMGIAASFLLLRLYRHGERGPLLFRMVAVCLATIFFFRYVFGRLHHEGGNALTGPLLILLAACGFRSVRGGRRLPTLVALGLLVAVAIVGGGFRIVYEALRGAATYPNRMASCHRCVRLASSRGGGARVLPEDSERLNQISRFVAETAPRGPILDLSNQSGLYFFLDRTNPTRFYQVPLMEFHQQEVLRDLEREPPGLVILSGGAWTDAPDGRSNADRAPLVWRYVLEHYPQQVQVGQTLFRLPGRSSEM